MPYKYKFTCEYTRTTLRPFQEDENADWNTFLPRFHGE